MGLGERHEDRLEEVERRARRERALGLQHLPEGLAGHVLHREEGVPVVLALVEDRDDVRVRERGRRACLAPEAADEGVVVDEVRSHHLERDLALEALVEGEVDGGHPAVGEARQHAVAAVEDAPDERVAGG